MRDDDDNDDACIKLNKIHAWADVSDNDAKDDDDDDDSQWWWWLDDFIKCIENKNNTWN